MLQRKEQEVEKKREKNKNKKKLDFFFFFFSVVGSHFAVHCVLAQFTQFDFWSTSLRFFTKEEREREKKVEKRGDYHQHLIVLEPPTTTQTCCLCVLCVCVLCQLR